MIPLYIGAAVGWGLSLHFYTCWRNAERREGKAEYDRDLAKHEIVYLRCFLDAAERRVAELEALQQGRDSLGRFVSKGVGDV